MGLYNMVPNLLYRVLMYGPLDLYRVYKGGYKGDPCLRAQTKGPCDNPKGKTSVSRPSTILAAFRSWDYWLSVIRVLRNSELISPPMYNLKGF